MLFGRPGGAPATAGRPAGGRRLALRRRSSVVLLLAGGLLGAPTTSLAAPGATSPTVAITTPSPDQLFYSPGTVGVAGTASDPVGVHSVGVYAREAVSDQWLEANGTLGTKAHTFSAALGGSNQTSTTWSLTLPSVPSGDYNLTATVSGASGEKASSSVEFGDGPVPTATSPGFLTLLFGRTQWVATSPQCAALAGQPTLVNIAQALQALTPPRSGVGDVINARTGATSERCVNYQIYPSWTDLATLQDQYGWTMVSGSADYQYMTSLTPAEQVTASCGSLTQPGGLYAQGDTQGWGMFAYPDNQRSTTIQADVVSECFAFGRTYQTGRNVQQYMAAPWFQRTNSILGGGCNEPTGCPGSAVVKNQSGKTVYYESPVMLDNLMDVAGGEWVVVQMYKLVEGENLTGSPTWDCNGPWQEHWTSMTELYCYDDYMAAVDQIPAGVQTVDPATVADAWDDNPAVTMAPVPAVQSVTPAGGPLAGGTQVIIDGSGFNAVASVTFGSQPAASYSVISPTEITATSPSGAGTANIQVMTNRGVSVLGSSDQFDYTPTVSGVSPNSGPAIGGTAVTITGGGFTNATAASFGGVPATSFSIGSDGVITAQAPPGTGGTFDVTVTSPGGTSSTSPSDHFSYAPVVSAVEPGDGPAVGGTWVTISGAGFTGATEVGFGGVPALSYSVSSDGQITADSPPGTETVDVTVATPDGTSSTSYSDQFAYLPIVSGISPSAGPEAGGTVVTISGAGFTGATGVSFGGVPALSYSVSSDGQITAQSPPGTGTVDVTVTTPTGQSSRLVGDEFTYQ